MRHYILAFLLLFTSLNAIATEEKTDCQSGPLWLRHACHRLHQVWYEGYNELYLTGYAWHNRYTYSPERINNYNELAWGGGLGKGFYDEKGNWHGLAAFAFLDSHKNWEPVAGYAYFKILHLNENTRLGAGYSVLVTARPDIFHGRPFPGALPWVMVNVSRFTLAATYIPGSVGAGNVLFVIGKIAF